MTKADEAPTRVVLYSYLSGTRKAVAEFRWSRGKGVTLTVLDPDAEYLARWYYDRGAPLDAEQRSVPHSDGPEFMYALLQPSRMAYFRFVDESDRDGNAGEELPGRAQAQRVQRPVVENVHCDDCQDLRR